MAQDVTIAGASYTDVPSINVPKTGGGFATFVDEESIEEGSGGDYDITSVDNGDGTQTLNIVDAEQPIDYWAFITNSSALFYGSRNMPLTVELNLPGFGSTNYNDNMKSDYMFFRAYPNSERAEIDLTINFPTEQRFFSLANMLFQAYGIKSCKITGNLSGVKSYGAFMDYTSNLQELDMEFDFTSCTGAQNLYTTGQENYNLTTIRFKENTLNQNCNINRLSALNSASLVSIGNSLISSAASKSITLHSTPKANLQTIMGTVTDGVFAASESGTVTLSDFITNTKGWTIA